MVVQNSKTKVQLRQSSYLQYLPGLYQDDEFMGQFLLIFEDIMGPIENMANGLFMYLDPLMTPEPVLHWLASWVDIALDSSWPLERRRELVKAAAELYQWRGTKRGLTEYLQIYTGTTPEIYEYIPGMRLDSDTRLGINTRLGSSGAGYHFTVVIDTGDNGEINMDTVRAIIEAQKPAYTIYTLQTKTGRTP